MASARSRTSAANAASISRLLAARRSQIVAATICLSEMDWPGCGTTLLERDLSEHLLAQNLPNERVDRPGARHVHEWPPRIDAVVDPWWSPVARRPHEVLGEVGLLCPRIRRLDFQATVEAHIHVRLQLPANTTVVALVPRLGTAVCDDPCDIAPARRARPIVSLRLIPPGVGPTLARTQSMRGAQSWKAPSCSSYFSLRC